MPTATTPNLSHEKVGDFIKSAVELGKATKVVAEKSGSTWTVTVTRPAAARPSR